MSHAHKTKVLFVCIHNSARSQMAEAFLRALGGEEFEAESAGFEPGILNPLAVSTMQEVGIDISHHTPQSVFELFKQGKRYNYVITVCDESSAERCPLFPGAVERIHWSFKDPSSLTGSEEEKRSVVALIREEIKSAVAGFIATHRARS
ncbi:arsenate reductase ArsC [Wolinella succinogenes]|uniref:PUTATIVE ARSENATE REDUCTASE n=1 Tax=Wolinella succinogenes (strain ATCC 29543 / DSM 1740 / CCUG 13145 / JCM 31913 / LMG 7466 / NCTC 11488 / FDC 602W) TaxID=273121 RepID=Q7M9Q6_WOLSU|nr:arsenate reductase ArsC [Wolinella succinogenes]CAE09876.1 PUTATIVE ARSENATE REDUCTASE [Wolinella succinogenes]VEG82090.1 Arsenate reductase [Wolinella succinogenes]HCZ18048.1 arsenate reductase ArsC [Helicobacter sp.]